MTIVPFGENFLGIEFNPHPEALEVMNYKSGKMISNNDSRAVAQYASYNGLVWKKGMDESCLENAHDIDPDKIIIRYADILLMYAEAKIELNQIDQSVLDAMNEVRARAYGVDKSAVSQYPAFTMKSEQAEIRIAYGKTCGVCQGRTSLYGSDALEVDGQSNEQESVYDALPGFFTYRESC